MNNFKIHTVDSAPEESKEALQASYKSLGMVPGLHGVMAESPATLKAYKALHQFFSKETAFNAEELTVIWQSINVENNCHYCVPGHTAIAHAMNVDPEITKALRNQSPLPNNKLQTLRETTLRVVRSRGHLSDSELEAFYEAGFKNQHLLEIFLGYSQKILSNYTNHVAKTPIDKPFKKYEWHNTESKIEQ